MTLPLRRDSNSFMWSRLKTHPICALSMRKLAVENGSTLADTAMGAFSLSRFPADALKKRTRSWMGLP